MKLNKKTKKNMIVLGIIFTIGLVMGDPSGLSNKETELTSEIKTEQAEVSRLKTELEMNQKNKENLEGKISEIEKFLEE